MRWPSGLNATEETESPCPSSGWPIGAPVLASHSRSVLSPLPLTMRWPSGLNATEVTAIPMPFERLANGCTRVGIPQPQRIVVTATDDALAIRAKRHRRDRKPHALRGGCFLATLAPLLANWTEPLSLQKVLTGSDPSYQSPALNQKPR